MNRSIAPILFGLMPGPERYYAAPIIAGFVDLLLLLLNNPNHLMEKVKKS